jgi:hypothetical protein
VQRAPAQAESSRNATSCDSSLGILRKPFFSICGNSDSVVYGRALSLEILDTEARKALPYSFCDLPSADHKRWTVRNKLEVVAAVSGGLLSLTETCSRYRMSVGEMRGPF